MSEKQYLGSIALTKLTHVLMEKKGKSGAMVKGIFIPIDANQLETKEAAVYLPIRVTVKDEADKYDQHGFVAKYVKREKKWSEMTDSEKESERKLTPILGNIKDFSLSGGNDNSGAASDEVLNEDDELPF